jgi:hypothetical protein
MPRPPKLRPDVNEIAFRTVRAATGQAEKPKPAGEGDPNALAAERGRLGGKKGGPARDAKLSHKRKRQIAAKAAKARWSRSRQ